jgi:predicted DNA-binding protein with PD1-like motif
MRTHAIRLVPGEDLRLALEHETRSRGLDAACIVSCVGSLARAKLRRAGGDALLELDGPLEIVSLVGTLSPDGPHLHVALADGEGRVCGGHLLAGCPIHTTAEIVLGELEGVSFARVLDPATGWRELVVQPRN